MVKLCDLHTHSVFSDGTFTPLEIIDKAVEIGLSGVAICDHNTVDGVPDFLKAAQGKPIEAVCGAEFSVDWCGTELHLLGLFIPENYLAQVSAFMLEVNERKEQSNIALIEALAKNGIFIDYARMKNASPSGKINRAHIAAELTNMGVTKSVKEAFDTLLAPKTGYYIEPKRITVFEMIDFIRSIRSVPVLAHPFLNLSKSELEVFLPLAKKHGLVGMECAYSTYDTATTEISFEMADKFGLKYSGGSDFHGSVKPDIQLGKGKGELKVPYEWLINLKK